MTPPRYLLRIALFLALGSPAEIALSFDIFDFQGAMTKLYGGAGITESRGGESLFYNPANLYKSQGLEYGVDIAPSSLSYKYTPPDPTVGTGNISAPLVPFVSAGIGTREKSSDLSFGFIFVPTGANTKTEIKEFPISLGGGTYQKADLENVRNAFKVGVGWAYTAKENLHFGASIVHDYIKSSSKIFLDGQEFLTIANENKLLLLRLGSTYHKKGLASFGFEIQPNVKSWYSLSAISGGSSEVKTFRQIYRPQVYGLGVKSDLPVSTQVFFQYRREDWVKGTYVDQNPTQTVLNEAPVEFLNAHSYVLGFEYTSSKANQFIGSFSFFGPNKGAGIAADDGSVMFNGRGIQDFESLKRYHITGGLSRKIKKNRSTYYGSYIRGTAASGEDTPSAGYYELTILMLGYGLYL